MDIRRAVRLIRCVGSTEGTYVRKMVRKPRGCSSGVRMGSVACCRAELRPCQGEGTGGSPGQAAPQQVEDRGGSHGGRSGSRRGRRGTGRRVCRSQAGTYGRICISRPEEAPRHKEAGEAERGASAQCVASSCLPEPQSDARPAGGLIRGLGKGEIGAKQMSKQRMRDVVVV